ncbi:MAG: thioesterase family protein [Staphylococcus equorum]|uniref:thioesterase family protein n=1 Tax=Staphylococcus TaxID=1279 RepID=UPI002555DBD3|nr:thioesterase family protein [Staphylococcus equorum]MDK9877605.1 thioesterase family protein [Staphylococcus equorum]MDN6569400.1 thioesterase family protein [Staphylococcus equorum]MDN6610130.1 thioesterase family protein [Staphylococcus equorum]MDN6698322.1 thioesterase family protein [Staphylococcus equorum]MDN6722006.1 thioesterase family protein [Staphylococcus equorum]
MVEEYIYRNTVQPSWIDRNNHMHDAQYYSIFSDAVVGFFESADLSISYRPNQEVTIFSMEAHISFLKELLLDDSFYIKVRIYDYDAKRVHLFLTMYNQQDERNATYEVIMMGVSNQTRRSMNFPQPVYDKIKAYFDSQQSFEVPKQLGHVISIPRK